MLKQGVNFIMTDNKIEQETKENVISYHTFIFPFTWGVGDIKRREFIDIVNKTENFVTDNKSESMLLGNYFTNSARRAIYNEHESDTDEPVWNYILKPEKLNGAKFIVSGTEKDITRNYEFELNAIRFKIFNTGAAALVYEVKNTRYNEYNDILKINNWGINVIIIFCKADGLHALTCQHIVNAGKRVVHIIYDCTVKIPKYMLVSHLITKLILPRNNKNGNSKKSCRSNAYKHSRSKSTE